MEKVLKKMINFRWLGKMVPETRIDLGHLLSLLKSLYILNLFFNSDNLMNFIN